MILPVKKPAPEETYIYVQFKKWWIAGELVGTFSSSIKVDGSVCGNDPGIHFINMKHVAYFTYKTKEQVDELIQLTRAWYGTESR